MWVVTLHHDNGYGKMTYQPICGADSEEAAHSAGSIAAAYYNNDLDNDTRAGVIDCNFLPRNNYMYSVKKHEGEWI